MITIERNESLFQNMVSHTDKDDSTVGVTIFMGEKILTGELISERRYFELVNEYLQDSTENLAFDCQLALTRDNSGDSQYFHLKNAVYIDSHGRSMPAEGCLLRGRVSVVQAVSIGSWLLPK
ncbi:hypothetical protein GCM10007938_07580 [Vibrio zhanjiangensis]|uniref:Uncharacterized protein n=1 Tax=Vibrio zhanjiangensis TaxID=1046128 RepID=A0ABQ6EWB5_9VIBR|nr:hypothetical protein [Vibrio zhanjiangensis]GLT16981.1 hypothetical protein GCM10007938_07580 [Vibrio zhanjiangensis]